MKQSDPKYLSLVPANKMPESVIIELKMMYLAKINIQFLRSNRSVVWSNTFGPDSISE